MAGTVANRSKFVTVLGWFAAVAGVFSCLVFLRTLIAVTVNPNALPKATHPIDVFVRDHVVLMGVLSVLVGALMGLTGIGLIRRRAWALRTGAALLVIGAIRQSIGFVRALSIPAESVHLEAARATSILLAVTPAVSILWIAFLIWFFRRDSIRAEFIDTSAKVS